MTTSTSNLGESDRAVEEPRARGVHDLRTRKSGANRFVEFHLTVSSEMTVRESHEITAVLSGGIKSRFPGSTVTIHVDPCEGDCEPDCIATCLLSEAERAAVADAKSPSCRTSRKP